MALVDPEQEKLLELLKKKKSRKKYRNKPTRRDGILFDSKAEADRWSELKMREKIGDVSGIERQVAYKFVVNGVPICSYRLDFKYKDRNGHTVFEDVKNRQTVTRLYLAKKQLMLALFGISIKEHWV